jgi:hypothetical protein
VTIDPAMRTLVTFAAAVGAVSAVVGCGSVRQATPRSTRQVRHVSPSNIRIVSLAATGDVCKQNQTFPCTLVLSTRALNKFVGGPSGFRVHLRNTAGESVLPTEVTLTVRRPPAAIGFFRSYRLRIARDTLSIAPHQTRVVLFYPFGGVPFGQETTLSVSIAGGQSKTYPVIFALPAMFHAA